MNLLATIMSLGRKEEIKEEENEFFGKLGRQNQGKTHESKRIAKDKEKKKNNNAEKKRNEDWAGR